MCDICNTCDNLGYTWEYERFFVVENHTTQSDYCWRGKKCSCSRGDTWYDHSYMVGWNMAIRVNGFVERYFGEVMSPSYHSVKATRSELSVEYIREGRREYVIGGEDE